MLRVHSLVHPATHRETAVAHCTLGALCAEHRRENRPHPGLGASRRIRVPAHRADSHPDLRGRPAALHNQLAGRNHRAETAARKTHSLMGGPSHTLIRSCRAGHRNRSHSRIDSLAAVGSIFAQY